MFPPPSMNSLLNRANYIATYGFFLFFFPDSSAKIISGEIRSDEIRFCRNISRLNYCWAAILSDILRKYFVFLFFFYVKIINRILTRRGGG